MKHAAFVLALIAMPTLLLPACSDDEDPAAGGSGGGTSQPSMVGAKGVTISEVSIYQSLKRKLNLDGTAGVVPIIAGRDAVIRVFLAADGDYDGKDVTARLEIEGGDPIEVTQKISVAASTEEDIASTINFSVPGDRIGETLSYSISILQEGPAADDNAAAHWPPSGMHDVPVEGPVNTLRVILAPFRYDTDGSGRLPDTSPETLEKYRNRLKQWYPVSDVEVTARAATPWNQPIDGQGNGWQEVGYEVLGMRAQDGESADPYYYGVFVPAASFGQYCGGACLLGVTLLNDQPADVGNPQLRLALGVGYDGYAYDTAAHEIGHAHGRRHADCGGADQVDPQYPHPNAQIGEWGLDTATMQLYAPTAYTDMMGYCDNVWISDYNFAALLARGKNVNLPKWHQATPKRIALVGLDGKGGATFGGFSAVTTELGGRQLPTTITDREGRRTSVKASVASYDHLPGGVVMVEVENDDVREIEIDDAGVRHNVALP